MMMTNNINNNNSSKYKQNTMLSLRVCYCYFPLIIIIANTTTTTITHSQLQTHFCNVFWFFRQFRFSQHINIVFFSLFLFFLLFCNNKNKKQQ
mmetsp:Transcript_12042/g.20119  ORF Transcript_12042/g.20119 Transcript_12042/m.20119 type:complete len:93 (+) Transcript_12042:124-402(+)